MRIVWALMPERDSSSLIVKAIALIQTKQRIVEVKAIDF